MERINASNLRRQSKPWGGKKVHLSDGNTAEIDKALVGPEGEPKFFYVKTGWFGTEIAGKEVLMPADLTKTADGGLDANMDKDTLETFPEWDDSEPITQGLIDDVQTREESLTRGKRRAE